jgi:glycyl-tRNA synthetase
MNVGLDSAILMNPQVWAATGHVGGFSDPLMDCRACKARYRADTLIEQDGANPAGMDFAAMETYVREHHLACPSCGKSDFTDIRQFNLMFKTFMGVTEGSSSEVYLRPETAQGIFVNFAALQRTSRKKMPFGVCQVGKAFRNEITPGNFTFRTREFEQMELEFFCKPGADLEWFAYWKDFCQNWLAGLGVEKENLRLRNHSAEELAFYSRATTDIEYRFPFGWGELWGIADRTDYDLGRHGEHSGKTQDYFDPETNEHYVPYVIEPSLGADRVALALLVDAYDEEALAGDNGREDKRVVLRLHPFLAPFKAAVLPLSKKLGEPAEKLYAELAGRFMLDYDDTGSIGKRYRRQDEIGTPFCITFDFDSLTDGSVTLRSRDSMAQQRLPMAQVPAWLEERVAF